MEKFKLFISNFLIYGFGSIISSVIPLIMLPVITRLMPDSFYYGLSDISNTIVQFGTALAVMGMYDAVFRLFFDREDTRYQKVVCSTALVFTLISSFVVFLILILFRNQFSVLFFGDARYNNVLYLTAISIFIGGTNNIVQIPTRTQNKRIVFIVLNTIGPIVSYAISIPLLLNGYYLIALPLAAVTTALTKELSFYVINRKWFDLRLFDSSTLKQLLVIAIPLLPNFLIYWIFNSSDRLMISWLIGASFTGIYAVGAKIGSAAQLIYQAFAGGWQFFAFSTMNEENQVENNSRVFEYLGAISFSCATLVFALSHWLFQLLFTGVYVDAYICAPYLFLAPLMQMLFQVACNQFLVIKKTWPNMLILSVGAIINVMLNLVLIPFIGIEGASIATLVGYIVSDIICCCVLIRMKLMVVSKRFIFISILMAGFIIVWRLALIKSTLLSLIAAVAVICIILKCYWSDIVGLFPGGKYESSKA
ncbi:lipopolysaccharide biosynthesis protein [uncultured Faecalibaculum sp.]|uniref:lipopolysaccharide biosynthesis protein n=1 Tax=uncultured Faecalibaculum sp. TaxID=1729681 RepID=UPI00272EA6A7|nr:oligosaccharide flippase family protein [uncultured Faecalibaculum sp.]